jgi:hypothetical protein
VEELVGDRGGEIDQRAACEEPRHHGDHEKNGFILIHCARLKNLFPIVQGRGRNVQAWSFEFIDREQHDAKESIAIVGGTTANGGNGVGVAGVFEVGGAGAGGGDCEVVEARFGGFCARGGSGESAELGFGVGSAIGDRDVLSLAGHISCAVKLLDSCGAITTMDRDAMGFAN